MNFKTMTQYDYFIQKLNDRGAVISDSQKFSGVNFLIEKDQINVITKDNGMLAIRFSNIESFCKELMEFKKVYG